MSDIKRKKGSSLCIHESFINIFSANVPSIVFVGQHNIISQHNHFIFSRSLFSLTTTSSAAASNDDSTDVVFVKVLMNFPVCVRGTEKVGCFFVKVDVSMNKSQ